MLASSCSMFARGATSATLASVASRTGRVAVPAHRRGSPMVVECKRKAKKPEDYQVLVISPPPRDLGVHSLTKNMQCGDMVEVSEKAYVVSGVTYKYKLQRGRYRKEHKRLDVQETGRYFLNMHLDNLLDKDKEGKGWGTA